MDTAKLVRYLNQPDVDMMDELVLSLYEKEYIILTDHVNYVFAVPRTERVTPVLLLAHVDTRRVNDMLYPVDVKRRCGVLYNANKESGCLGADDRAGVYIIMEMIERMPNLPYLLFTTGEEVGFTGMKAFLQANHPELAMVDEDFWKGKKIWEPYVNDIYAAIQYDRQGYNDVVCYHQQIPKLLDIVEKFGYTYTSGSSSDSRDFSKTTNIAHLNLSCGFIRKHTVHEQLLLGAIPFAVNSGIRICDSITEPYRVPKPVEVDKALTCGYYKSPYFGPPLVAPKPTVSSLTCTICGKKRRKVTYLKHCNELVCDKCIHRAGGEENITEYSAPIMRMELERYRLQSYKANVPFDVPCPLNTAHERVVAYKDGSCFCEQCNTWFMPVGTDEVIFWSDRDKDVYYKQKVDDPSTVEKVKLEVNDKYLDVCWTCGHIEAKGRMVYAEDVDGTLLGALCRTCDEERSMF